MMKQIQTLLQSISVRNRILIGASALLVGIAIFVFSYWRHERDFRPLYTALSVDDAAAVTQKLREKAIEYRLTEGGAAIQIASDKVSETRLEMARSGLPKTGRIGFELFDKAKFGATDFTERINFRRALEGELERSILSMEEVESARVHITFPKESVFAENRLPAKGSVLLKLRQGVRMTEQGATTIRYLLASAVEGLSPESVSVMDMQGNLLSHPKEKSLIDGPEPSEAVIQFRRKIEQDLLLKINSTLEPLLGPDRFRASVVAQCDFSSGEQSDEIIDPAQSVITSEQRTTETSSSAAASGVAGTASNLPRPTPRPGSNTAITRRSDTVAYQTSRTMKRIRLPQGNITRLSASVLVDQTVRWEGSGSSLRRVVVPPSEDTLRRITDLVSASIGIQTARGDRLVVETLPFGATLNQPPPPQPQTPPATPWQRVTAPENRIPAAAAGLAALALAIGLFLYLRRRTAPPILATPATVELPPASPASPAPLPMSVAEAVGQELERHLANQQKKKNAQLMTDLEASGSALQQITQDVVDLANQHPELCAGVLRGWLEEKKTAS